MKKTVVISLGGSLLFPKTGLDVRFAKQFRSLILSYIRRGWRFVIICGGGTLAREYQAALKKSGVSDSIELDWIGIRACRMNAHYLRMIVGNAARRDIITNPSLVRETRFGSKRVLFGGGEKPGQTSDHVAVQCAINIRAATVINLSNIDYIYDRDPKKYTNAKRLHTLSWVAFQKLFPRSHTPGSHVPFDPIATALAKKHRLTVAFLGANLSHVNHFLQQKKFRGTVVTP